MHVLRILDLSKVINLTIVYGVFNTPRHFQTEKIRISKKKNVAPSPPPLPQRDPTTSIFCFSDEMSLVSYFTHRKKNVLLLSTAHATEAINAATSKPEIIMDYNKNKGGVDTFDKMIRGYTCRRKANRWPMTIFFNMVDIAALAAYRLYGLEHPTWYAKNVLENRRVFLRELAYELAEPHLKKKEEKGRLKPSVKTAMTLIGFKFKAAEASKTFPEKYMTTKSERCDPCKAERGTAGAKGKKDTKTTATCDICYVHRCVKHHIRVCEDCYMKYFTTPEDGMTDDDEEEDDVAAADKPSTSGEPPAKRPRGHSPVNLAEYDEE